MRALGGAVLGVFAVACGGGPIPYDQLTHELIRTLCHRYAECKVAYSEELCVTMLSDDVIISRDYQAAIAEGRIKYDGAAARTCLDNGYGRSCEDLLSGNIGAEPACDLVFVGTVAEGGTCHDSECAAGLYCSSQTTATCPGTCLAKVGAGGAATSSVQCQDELVLSSNTCQAPLPAGSPCTSSSQCADRLYCNNGVGGSGSCVAWSGVGQPCSTTQRCTTFLNCVDGVCATPPTVGEPCFQAGVTCQLTLHCDSTSTTCAKPVGAGGHCTSDGHCEPPLGCGTDDTCQARAAVGASCSVAPCVEDAFCDTASVCQARIAVGAPCTGSTTCARGAYCASGVCTSSGSTCG